MKKTCPICKNIFTKHNNEYPYQFIKRICCSKKCSDIYRTKDITGRKFNRLTAISFSHKKGGIHFWNFVCDCGKNHIASKYIVMRGGSNSCGCLATEKFKIIKANQITHGMTNTRFYSIWEHIQNRCNSKNNKLFNRYGGRGIKCLWTSFEHFRDDMYDSYLKHVDEFGEKNTTIDRIDNNGNYCKENCRWADRHTQSRNTSRNVFIEYNGKKYCIADLAIKLNVPVHIIRYYILKH